MSVYHTSFNYLGKQSYENYGLVISHFADNADSGETETFMSMDPIYTDNAYGTRRIDYGAKYSSVAIFRITVLKQDGSAMSVSDIRNYLKWLTGARTNSPLDLLIDNEVKYSFIGRFTNAWHYKMDAKTIGLILEFTSISPWAYLKIDPLTIPFSKSVSITIDNISDDLYEYVYPKITYTNGNTKGNLEIRNESTNETTLVQNLGAKETITIDNNFMITSSNENRVFGSDFNFVFPRFKAGKNKLALTGTGSITIEYMVYLKVGDCARDINAISDPICNEDGEIQIDTLDWSRISNTPTTISGYGLSNDLSNHFYNKTEINNTFSELYDTIMGVNETFSEINIEMQREIELGMNHHVASVEEKIDEYQSILMEEIDYHIQKIGEEIDDTNASISDIHTAIQEEMGNNFDILDNKIDDYRYELYDAIDYNFLQVCESIDDTNASISDIHTAIQEEMGNNFDILDNKIDTCQYALEKTMDDNFRQVYQSIDGTHQTISDINTAMHIDMDNRFKNVYIKSEIDAKNDILYNKIEAVNQYADSIMNDTAYIGSKLDRDYYTKQYIDAYLYTKTDTDKKIAELASKNYTKAQVDAMFKSTDEQIGATRSLFNNVYTKKEADFKHEALSSDIDDVNLNVNSLRDYVKTIKDDTSENYYAKPYVDDNFYTKRDIDDIVKELNRDPSTGEVVALSWVEITGKPTTLAGYQIKSEVVELINSSINSLEIDEGELNRMLVEVFG